MLIGYILYRYGVKESEAYASVAHMKWDTLKKLYRVNPDRWEYRKIRPTGMYRKSFNKVLLYKVGEYDAVRVHLSYFGYVAFRFAKMFGQKRDKGLEIILDSIQEDIDKLRATAQEQISSANEQMEDIKLRLKEEQK